MKVTRLRQVLLCCGLAAACRAAPEQGSGTESLDNLARGQGDALVVNDCTGATPMDPTTFRTLRDKGQIQVSDGLAETLRLTLADIKPVLDLYFGAGYELSVRADAAAVCKASGRTAAASFDATETGAAGQSFASCWLQNFYVDDKAVGAAEAKQLAAAGTKVREEFVAVVASTEQAVRQSTLRILGLALFQRLALLEKQGPELVVTQPSPLLTQAVDALTVDLLQAVAGRAGALASVRSLLPSDPGTWTKATVPALWAGFKQSHPAQAAALGGIAAGESFDSYYHCAATRKTMQTSFPASYAVFDQQVAPELRGGQAAGQQGLALCGGGLFPNLGCGGLLDGLGLGGDNGFPILSGIGDFFGFGDD